MYQKTQIISILLNNASLFLTSIFFLHIVLLTSPEPIAESKAVKKTENNDLDNVPFYNDNNNNNISLFTPSIKEGW